MRIAALLVVLLAAGAAQAIDFPPLTGRVVDAAGILSAATRADLTQQLEAHERATGQQIVVATVPNLGGLPIEDYGFQLGRHWGIGRKEKDNGVLLIVASAEHKVRIEVGYGLEGDLTDALSSNIINTRIVPAFRKGDFDGGVRAGVGAIMAALGGQPQDVTQPQPQSEPSPKKALPVGIFWLIVLFIVMSGFGGGRRGGGGLARAILWGTVLNGMSHGRRGRSGGFGGGGFGGGGGGGFGGGGGSFGGGGASGSW